MQNFLSFPLCFSTWGKGLFFTPDIFLQSAHFVPDAFSGGLSGKITINFVPIPGLE